jgi:RNA polymerase sigma-70 factor (ECF subfamily)
LTIAEILEACLTTGDESAWLAFIARFQPLIASSVYRVARRYAVPNPALVDDLVQETYLRLCRDNCRNLRNFQAQHDEAIFGYIKVIAVSVALDYFRTRATLKRRAESEEAVSEIEASVSAGSIEHTALLNQIEDRLRTTQSERDCTVFWLYYKQGYTAKDIAAIPGLGLSQKGVESCIYRLTQYLREVIAAGRGQSFSGKGNPPQTTLGVVK